MMNFPKIGMLTSLAHESKVKKIIVMFSWYLNCAQFLGFSLTLTGGIH